MTTTHLMLRDIVSLNRRTGNTTWILKSAIMNPNCIIVCHSMQYATFLNKQYIKMKKELPFFKKIYVKFFKKGNPIITSTNFNFHGNKLPVIFDNSVILWYHQL